IKLTKRILDLKRIYSIGKQFEVNQGKGKRKGKRYFYFTAIIEAFNAGRIDNVKALIDFARIDFKINKNSRQTKWRLKKELLEMGIPEDLLRNLSNNPQY
ncbi:MAG: hypothetical protein ACFFCV_18840, partial [Promethearchaeota archaeon]